MRALFVSPAARWPSDPCCRSPRRRRRSTITRYWKPLRRPPTTATTRLPPGGGRSRSLAQSRSPAPGPFRSVDNRRYVDGVPRPVRKSFCPTSVSLHNKTYLYSAMVLQNRVERGNSQNFGSMFNSNARGRKFPFAPALEIMLRTQAITLGHICRATLAANRAGVDRAHRIALKPQVDKSRNGRR
ncbi:hypothetical protein RHA1_ro07022 [Rhodococcus jostii RHA1]|uniref:Uncharacterized protein n=1 Tax=Rhodococcus jostii (strain RHA1) TaxID=101510 RepID=Q0S0Z8_RHOJR|nr:hypothetical protein RHA1_ro07022 [Rhodococcus jostii RHA1]